MSEHVTDIDVARFHAGKLDRIRVEEVGAHVRECAGCAARVFDAKRTRESVSQTFLSGQDGRERLAYTRWIPAAAMLALIAGLASYAIWNSRQRVVAPVPVAVKRAPVRRAHPWDAIVADALRRGTIEAPAALREVRRDSHDVVRGPSERKNDVHLLAPIRQAVESQTPLFRWTPSRGTYEVIVARNGEVVARSGKINSESWAPPQPLARDAQYEWQLTIDANGKRTRIPPPEEGAARFRIISEEEAKMLDAARVSADPIAAGVIAARVGVIDEALNQLGTSSDPRAQALAETIRRW